MKALIFSSIALFSSIGFAAQTKTCAFPEMQNVPIKISIDGAAATIEVPGSPLNKCSVTSKDEVSNLNRKLIQQGKNIGPISKVLICHDDLALSTYEIYFTPSPKVYFYIESQGLLVGSCNN